MELETICPEDEQLMRNILLDDESFSSSESNSSRKRRANIDLNEDSIKQKRRERKLKKLRSKWRKKSKKISSSAENSTGKKMIVRPNYFVGIQVSNPEVLAYDRFYDEAAELVEICTMEHKEFFNRTVSLNFSGLKTFGNQVLFATVEESEVLDKVQVMATDLENAFEKLTGVPAKKTFKPHLTIFKVSKDFKLRRKGAAKISSNVYSNMINTVFGAQIVQSVQLLSMNKPKDEKGYYYCSHQVKFDVSSSELDDHSECCKSPLSGNSDLHNISQIKQTLQQEKDMVKRRFHSLSLSTLSSVFSKDNQPEDEGSSTLKTLLIITAATAAIIAAVRGFCSSK
ncbi:hypothetical protein C0J52_11161 [Blattella germanica]|nr:hypothetical protein C0J52_11161 [Blattella germanica]